jgi:membrane protein
MIGVPEMIRRVRATLARERAEHHRFDRAIRTQEQYGRTGASQQAGAVTYFGFLSVFPILALAFFVVGWIARFYPDARQDLLTAIDSVLPTLVGKNPGQVRLKDIQDAAGAAGIIGAVGLLYSGLGWISALRTALIDVFEVPKRDQPNWIFAKLRDALALITIGVILLASVALSGFITRGVIGPVISILAGLAADSVLFFAMFMLLARPRLRQRYLWQGAFLGGIGFEALKQLSRWLLANTQGTPAFQVFGVSLILLVWINYFTRVTLYAAAYAVTGQPRPAGEPALVQGPQSPPMRSRRAARPVAAVAVVSSAAGAIVGFVAARRRS